MGRRNVEDDHGETRADGTSPTTEIEKKHALRAITRKYVNSMKQQRKQAQTCI